MYIYIYMCSRSNGIVGVMCYVLVECVICVLTTITRITSVVCVLMCMCDVRDI